MNTLSVICGIIGVIMGGTALFLSSNTVDIISSGAIVLIGISIINGFSIKK